LQGGIDRTSHEIVVAPLLPLGKSLLREHPFIAARLLLYLPRLLLLCLALRLGGPISYHRGDLAAPGTADVERPATNPFSRLRLLRPPFLL
jgi:hypothetical protein